MDPSSKNRPSEMDQLLVRGQKTVQVGKYENQKKNIQWIDQQCTWLKAWIFNNLLLSQGKVHLAKMIRFPKMGPLIFTLCFLTLAGRSKKQRERRAHFRVLEK